MTQGAVLALCLVIAAGAALAVQSPLNAALARSVDSALVAAATSFGVGFVLLCLVALAKGDASAFARITAGPTWLLAGGVLGAAYVWTVVWAVPTLGVLTTISALVLGQVSAGLVLDHIGAFGVAAQPVSTTRLAAAGLVAAGLVLSRV